MIARPAGSRADSPARTAARILAGTQAILEPRYRAAIDELAEPLRHIAGYHAGWWDDGGRPCAAAGKRIRAALVLTCAAAADGSTAASRTAAAAATAIELVHDFSLLHDDVMDRDRTRRHRPAAWVLFGTGNAILTGDALLMAATRQLESVAAIKVLSRAVTDLCKGQFADLALEERTDVRMPECVAMAEAKTGALLQAACQLGAMAGGAGPATVEGFRLFGRRLGLAFQLVDDVLGIEGDPRATGKPVGADLSARKKSLPVVAALTSGTPEGDRLARLYHRPEPMSEPEVLRATALVEHAGGLRWARQQARQQLDGAFQALDGAGPVPSAAKDLRTLAHMIATRDV